MPLYVVAFLPRLHNLAYLSVQGQRKFLRFCDVFCVDLEVILAAQPKQVIQNKASTRLSRFMKSLKTFVCSRVRQIISLKARRIPNKSLITFESLVKKIAMQDFLSQCIKMSQIS